MRERTPLPVVVSYSGGSSSERLVDLAIERRDTLEHVAVVSADTGDEHEWTYEAIERVAERCRAAGVDFLIARADETLSGHLMGLATQEREIKRLDHPPLWIDKGSGSRGRAQHRCTRRFKVRPMREAVSAWLASRGLPKRAEKWIGFSADEAHRATKAIGRQDVAWERLEFPLIRLGLKRGDVRADLVRRHGTAPRFSMCVHCPFKSPARWRETSDADFAKAVTVDEAIRDLDEVGLTDGPAYCSSALVPLRFGPPPPSPQLDLDLPGLGSSCDSGACFL